MKFRTNIRAAQPAKETWQSDAFINMYLTRTDGSRMKFDGKLREDNPDHAELIEAFRKDPEGAAEWVRANIIYDFREVNAETSGLGILKS